MTDKDPTLRALEPSTLAHVHVFDEGNPAAERGTRAVMWITAATMVIEILAGWWFNSMALLADGWHMSSHALALGLSAFAYAAARRYARDPRFAFGTWKIEVLAGFASSISLLGVALLMVIGSVERLLSPQPIFYREAMVVAALGLVVNLGCALILARAHTHDEHHDHGSADAATDAAHSHGAHPDLNLRSAYVHVVTDAATSVLALVALAGGWLYGWSWLDPAMGLVGAALVAAWAKNLLRDTGKVLLDREMDHPVVEEIRVAVQAGPHADRTQVADLHVWRVGRQAFACTVTVTTTDETLTAARLHEQLVPLRQVVHTTIEIRRTS